MIEQIYTPEKDSFLMKNVLKEKLPKLLKNTPNLKFLEIGSGSGVQLETALKLGVKRKNIFACDINREATRHCKKLGFNCVNSNLFQKIKNKYDIIIFNPPYLPENENEPEDSKLATTGGKNGGELINKFLKRAKQHLTKNGRIFLLTSSLTKKIDWQNYKKRKISNVKIFFEELYMWELTQ
mgnify:CR=1 FL=1|jgi:release factor glutamine methyltransferase